MNTNDYFFKSKLNSCGPDPKVCCQFDFKRLGGVYGCPGPLPQKITERNVKKLARLLLDQLRKKSELYRTENQTDIVVLFPLGDDFRYTDLIEASDQFNNYEKLIDYMNSRRDWNVRINFGTLGEFFQRSLETSKQVSIIEGDFFTYADHSQDYWSGYFTTRPYYKRLDRVVEHYLRAAELVYSLSSNFHSTNAELNIQLFASLLEARRNLGVFQHHDGITGTARKLVVKDYEDKYNVFLSSLILFKSYLNLL